MKESFESNDCSKFDESTKSSLKRLLEQAYGKENSVKRLDSLTWTCGMNPHAEDHESRIYFIKNNKNILAYNGRMPANFLINGKVHHCYFVHESFVHVDYRSKGLGIRVNKDILNDSNTLCVGLWANKKVLPLLLKIGWQPVGELIPQRKILKIDSIAEYKIKSNFIRFFVKFFGKVFLTFKNRKKQLNNKDVEVINIERFTDNMKQPLKELLEKYKNIAYRDPEYLNWKYVDIPYQDYKIYGVKKDDHLKGYVILRIRENQEVSIKNGLVVDLLCDPDERECFDVLIMKAEEYFTAEGADFIACLVTHGRLRNWMKDLGFTEKRINNFFILANIDRTEDQDNIKEINNWYLTYGDSDYDMLSEELIKNAR